MPRLSSTPWRRAPLLLLRRPSVALAVLGAVVILATAAASMPAFLSSAAGGALHGQMDRTCATDIGPQYVLPLPYRQTPDREGLPVGRHLIFDRVGPTTYESRNIPRMTQVVSLLAAMRLRPSSGGLSGAGVWVVSRQGFRPHIHVVRQVPGRGMWVPDRLAGRLGLHAGQRVRLTVGGTAVKTRIVGIYRDLRARPDEAQPFWCSMRAEYRGNPLALSSRPILPFVLLDQASWLRFAGVLRPPSAEERIEYLIDSDGLKLRQATTMAAGIRRMRLHLETRYPSYLYDTGDYSERFSTIVARAALTKRALRTSVLPIGITGAAVALLIVAAAASYWVDRRRQEVDLLVSRGVGPAALAAKAVLEAAPAVVVGGALGWLAAVGLVSSIGPSPLIEAGALAGAAVYAACASAAAFAILAAVVAVRCRDLAERPRGARRGWVARAPWEVAVLAIAGGVLAWTLPRGAVAGQAGVGAGTVARLDPATLVFPLLFLAGVIALVARVGVIVVRRLSRAGRRWPNSLYLAARRVAGAPAAALLMLAAAGLPAGVFLYGAAATASVQRTLDAEAHLLTGSDVVATLNRPMPGLVQRFPSHATAVERLNRSHLNGLLVDVLGVNTRTFEGGAFWTDAIAEAPLGDLMARIRDPGGRGPVPVIVPGATPGRSTLVIVNLEGQDVDIPVRIVGTPRYFPAQRTGYQVVVMDHRVLDRYRTVAEPQLWVRGDEHRVNAAFADAGVHLKDVALASDVLAGSVDEPLTYTFEYLTALALFTAAVGLGAMVLYLESRTRTRRVAYVLARRMGLTRRAHLGSIVAELGSMLGAGVAVGGTLAAVAVRAVASGLDVDPAPPEALITIPWPVLGVASALAGAVVIAASLAVQWASDRASPAEVLNTPR